MKSLLFQRSWQCISRTRMNQQTQQSLVMALGPAFWKTSLHLVADSQGQNTDGCAVPTATLAYLIPYVEGRKHFHTLLRILPHAKTFKAWCVFYLSRM